MAFNHSTVPVDRLDLIQVHIVCAVIIKQYHHKKTYSLFVTFFINPLLATHSILAHQKARNEGWLTEDQFTQAETNAQDLMEFSLDNEAQDWLKRFLSDRGNE